MTAAPRGEVLGGGWVGRGGERSEGRRRQGRHAHTCCLCLLLKVPPVQRGGRAGAWMVAVKIPALLGPYTVHGFASCGDTSAKNSRTTCWASCRVPDTMMGSMGVQQPCVACSSSCLRAAAAAAARSRLLPAAMCCCTHDMCLYSCFDAASPGVSCWGDRKFLVAGGC